jgi:3-oxoacyl-[acyl-carrier protein] reductase
VDLSGQVALVTGASRGLGRAIAERLAACGASVAAVARTEDGLKGTLEAIRAAGGTAEPFPGNVGKADDVAKIIEAVEARFPKVHVLVNNAGITRDGLMLRMEDSAWDEVIDTNLNSVFYFCRAVGAMMMRQRYGRIINVSSVSGMVGNPGQANYSASKAGVIGFTRTIARELASRNITVNAVAPGFIETDMTTDLPQEMRDFVTKQAPAGRLGTPADVAPAIVFLCSEEAAYITGQTLTVDGGLTL